VVGVKNVKNACGRSVANIMKTKKICIICNNCFSAINGGFTRHLRDIHKLTLQQYVVLSEYNNIEPKCACGFCNEMPYFRRGKFFKFASGHDLYSFFSEQYIKKFGMPKCKNCGKQVKFRRRKPLSFCSRKCSGIFNKEVIVRKMTHKIKERWKDEEYKKKTLEKIKKGNDKSWLENYDARCESLKKRWKSETYRQKMSLSLKNLWKTEKYANNVMSALQHSLTNRLSKLHIKTRTQLELDKLDFESEKHIGRYIVDELHKHKKIIIEVNGDYIHANPKNYKAKDVIKVKNKTYLAEQKWDWDKNKIQNLEKMGYKIFIIWQTDNLQEKQKELLNLIESTT